MKYGPHERNVLDFWKAKSDRPTPLFIWIHGGGFRAGDKGSLATPLLRELLDQGISVASLNYRLSHQAIAPACFHDCARAVQSLRSHSNEWGLDPSRFAAGGGSAGAGLSQWLAFHDDLAEPDSSDELQRQSTRLSCVITVNGQTSYDPRFIKRIIPGDAFRDPPLKQLFGVDISDPIVLPAKKIEVIEECSPITHLTKDDPPILMVYRGTTDPQTAVKSRGAGIHHPLFGLELKKRMDALGIESTIKTESGLDPKEAARFLKRHFKMP